MTTLNVEMKKWVVEADWEAPFLFIGIGEDVKDRISIIFKNKEEMIKFMNKLALSKDKLGKVA